MAMIDGMENPKTAENLASHLDDTVLVYDIVSSPQYQDVENSAKEEDVPEVDPAYLLMEEYQALQTYCLIRLMSQQEHHWGDCRFKATL